MPDNSSTRPSEAAFDVVRGIICDVPDCTEQWCRDRAQDFLDGLADAGFTLTRTPAATYNGHMDVCWRDGCQHDEGLCRKANHCVVPAAANGPSAASPGPADA